jgi:dolichol-phosphate mannosyltransferase
MGPPVLSIVIPTYCEAENLAVLLPELCCVIDKADIPSEIIVVDDNSPDMTPQVCEPYITSGRVRLIRRHSKRGLATAVLRGFHEARGRTVVVMDADLSHPPEVVPAMVEALERKGVEMVIGSRYTKGACTDDRWTFCRWLQSHVATLLAWPLTSVKDPMAGFFAVHRERVLRARGLQPIGYKIALELMVKCPCRWVVELPIHFKSRCHGESKINLKVQWDYLRHLVRLYAYLLHKWMERHVGSWR